jgi:hypothetical protein
MVLYVNRTFRRWCEEIESVFSIFLWSRISEFPISAACVFVFETGHNCSVFVYFISLRKLCVHVSVCEEKILTEFFMFSVKFSTYENYTHRSEIPFS